MSNIYIILFVLIIITYFQQTVTAKMSEHKLSTVTVDALTRQPIRLKDSDAMLEVKAAFADSVDSTIFLHVKIIKNIKVIEPEN